MAVNKCNISKLVLPYLNKLLYGSKIPLDNNSIYENYINFLGCPTISYSPCHTDICLDVTVIYSCTLNISQISEEIEDNTVTLTVQSNLPESQVDNIFDDTFDQEFT